MRIYFLFVSFCTKTQLSSDGNQTTSTLSITLSRVDSGRYLSCRAYNPALQSETLEDGWRLDIQCEFKIHRKLYTYIIMVIIHMNTYTVYGIQQQCMNEMYLLCALTQHNTTPNTNSGVDIGSTNL